jgi:hypothetical protein
MASIANMVDLVVGSCHQKKSNQDTGMKHVLLIVYMMIFGVVSCMYDFCWRPSWSRSYNGFSFVYFVGSAFQLLGLLSLCMKIRTTKSVAGISSQSLGLTATSLACRAFCTTIYDGYLPVDKSGDMWAQIVDFGSLAVVIYMLYSIHKTYAHTYSDDTDEMSVKPIVAACAVSALFIRADLNRDPLFDWMWAFGMNVEIFQMLPQLYMLTKFGGVVENTTAHFVVNVFLACLCRFAFWIWAAPKCEELSGPDGRIQDMNLGGYFILGAHVLEILVMLDFVYYYVSAVWHGKKSVYLPKVDGDAI